MIVDKIKKKTMAIDAAIPGGTRVREKERKRSRNTACKKRNCQIMAN